MPRKILITETGSAERIAFKACLQHTHYQFEFVDTPEKAYDAITHQEFNLVIYTDGFKGLTLSELQLWLHETAPKRKISPLILAVLADDTPQKRLDALWSGAIDVLPMQFESSALQARLRNLFRQSDAAAELERRNLDKFILSNTSENTIHETLGKIGVIGSNAKNVTNISSRLSKILPTQVIPCAKSDIFVSNPQSMDPALKCDVYLILSDENDNITSLSLLSELRSYSHTRLSNIVMAVNSENTQIGSLALDMGINDLIFMSAMDEEFALRLSIQLERKYEADRLRAYIDGGLALVIHDPLTKIFNRRYAENYLTHLQKQNLSDRGEFAIMLIDIDHFKKMNDLHGHLVGDDVLKALANRLRDNLRAHDVLARMGGDEFLLIMPSIKCDGIKKTAERLLNAISARPFILRSGTKQKITISIGVAIGNEYTESVEALLHKADQALYQAKEDGRDRVSFRI